MGLFTRKSTRKAKDPCAGHCPRELEHEKYFRRGLPTPCGCKPVR